jgi:hypothetical protein
MRYGNSGGRRRRNRQSFWGPMIEAKRDVTFLVRPWRAANWQTRFAPFRLADHPGFCAPLSRGERAFTHRSVCEAQQARPIPGDPFQSTPAPQVHQLAHFTDFDPKYRLPIPSNKLFVNNIAPRVAKTALSQNRLRNFRRSHARPETTRARRSA